MSVANLFYKAIQFPGKITSAVGRIYSAQDYMVRHGGSAKDHGDRLFWGGTATAFTPMLVTFSCAGVGLAFNSAATGLAVAASSAVLFPALVMWGVALYCVGKKQEKTKNGQAVLRTLNEEVLDLNVPSVWSSKSFFWLGAVQTTLVGGLGTMLWAQSSLHALFCWSVVAFSPVAFAMTVKGTTMNLQGQFLLCKAHGEPVAKPQRKVTPRLARIVREMPT